MSKLFGRHSLSQANNRDNYGTPAFGHADAPLMPEGRVIAKKMGVEFEVVHGIIPADTPVAVSMMERSPETALEAGFIDLTRYALLNEVDTQLPHPELKAMMANREHTEVALRQLNYSLRTLLKRTFGSDMDY